MKRKYLHIAMFRAIDCLYDELKNPPEILSKFLADANTYLWADHKTADPAIQADFDRSMDRQHINDEVEAATAYNAVKNFLSEQYPKFVEWFEDGNGNNPTFAELFERISLDEWKELCNIVTEEESQQ